MLHFYKMVSFFRNFLIELSIYEIFIINSKSCRVIRKQLLSSHCILFAVKLGTPTSLVLWSKGLSPGNNEKDLFKLKPYYCHVLVIVFTYTRICNKYMLYRNK